METMSDKGGNSFEGSIGTNLAKFEILSNGAVKCRIKRRDFPTDKIYLALPVGLMILKYPKQNE